MRATCRVLRRGKGLREELFEEALAVVGEAPDDLKGRGVLVDLATRGSKGGELLVDVPV